MLHTPAHKHVGDAGKPGQIVNRIDENPTAAYILHGTATGRFTSTTSNIEEVQRGSVTAEDVSKSKASIAHTVRDLMYQHGVSPFNQAQKQAKT